MSIKEEQVVAKFKELSEDTNYIDDLVGEMLVNEGIPSTVKNKQARLNSSYFKVYLMSIARSHLGG